MNRLSFLMDYFDLNSSKIANIAHVDPSLVSKWRNGHRVLRRSSDYVYLISQYIYQLDQKNLKQLDVILSENNSTYSHLDENEKIRYLGFWLTESSIDSILAEEKNSQHLSYKEEVGSKAFKTDFIDLLSKKANHISSSITLVIYNNTSLFTEDIDWLTRVLEVINDQVNQGVQVRIYVNESSVNESAQFLISHLLSLLINENLQLTYEDCCLDMKRYEIFLIKDDIVIRSIGRAKDIFLEFLDNKHTSTAYMNYFDNIFRENDLCYYEFENIEAIIYEVIKAGTRRDHSYYMSKQLFFTCMTTSILEEVLEENNCTLQEKERCLKFYKKINSNFKTNIRRFDNYHIYFEEELEKCLALDNYTDSHLSSILARPIKISNKQFSKLLISTMDRIKQNNNYQVMLIEKNKSSFSNYLPNCWVKDAETIILWSYELMPIAVTIKDTDLINIMIDNIKKQYICEISKEKLRHMTLKKLERLVRLI